jgi:hypothetical protein
MEPDRAGIVTFGSLAMLLAMCWCVPASAELLPDAACAIVKKTVAQRGGLPETGPPGIGWFCDITPAKDARLFLVALRSGRPTPYTNLMGWYAVDRVTGAIYRWDDKAQRKLPLDKGHDKG